MLPVDHLLCRHNAHHDQIYNSNPYHQTLCVKNILVVLRVQLAIAFLVDIMFSLSSCPLQQEFATLCILFKL